MKYWKQQGTYQSEWDALTQELVPSMGKADSLAGELVRSANRIYYDAYNNGFCNNTSGAINFIKRFLQPLFPNDVALEEAIDEIEPKTNTSGYSNITKHTEVSLDLLVDRVFESIRDNPSLRTTATQDMFDFQDKDHYEENEDDYDEEDEKDRCYSCFR